MGTRVKIKEAPASTANQTAGVCAHHWKIDSADGPTSSAVCKRCGAVSEFSNSFPDPNAFKKEKVFDLPKHKVSSKTGAENS